MTRQHAMVVRLLRSGTAVCVVVIGTWRALPSGFVSRHQSPGLVHVSLSPLSGLSYQMRNNARNPQATAKRVSITTTTVTLPPPMTTTTTLFFTSPGSSLRPPSSLHPTGKTRPLLAVIFANVNSTSRKMTPMLACSPKSPTRLRRAATTTTTTPRQGPRSGVGGGGQRRQHCRRRSWAAAAAAGIASHGGGQRRRRRPCDQRTGISWTVLGLGWVRAGIGAERGRERNGGLICPITTG